MTYDDFFLKICERFLSGNKSITVVNDANKRYSAKIIGFDFEHESVRVEFDSDNMTEKRWMEIPSPTGAFFAEMNEDHYGWVDVPVKRMYISYKSLELN